MFICSNCFSDIEIKSHVDSLSTEKGQCNYCKTKSASILPIDELLDFFEELFSIYKTDADGLTLVDKIENDWNLFSNMSVASEIISDLIPLTSVSAWDIDVKVNYIDEIEENISYWNKLKENLKWEERFLVALENIKDIEWDKFFNDQITYTDSERFFRARIHKVAGEPTFPVNDMGSPKKEEISSGRANPQGISYLYLSTSPETTFYETKALFHDEISVGEFKVKFGEELNLVDFTEKGSAFTGVGNLKNHTKRIQLKKLISKDLSKPIRRYDSDIEYIPTQFICEFIRIVIGANGILFNSSLHRGGQNLVVFQQDLVECINVKKCIVAQLEIKGEEIV